MRAYVSVLKAQANQGGPDLDLLEAFWTSRVLQFFPGKPFTLKLDPSRRFRTAVGDVLRLATLRQEVVGSATMYAGAVMQHPVGAKLEA